LTFDELETLLLSCGYIKTEGSSSAVKFHHAVDEYLETCKMLGREPQKTYKGIFNVRIDPQLHKKAYQQSLKSGISLNTFVKQAIEKEVEHG